MGAQAFLKVNVNYNEKLGYGYGCRNYGCNDSCHFELGNNYKIIVAAIMEIIGDMDVVKDEAVILAKIMNIRIKNQMLNIS